MHFSLMLRHDNAVGYVYNWTMEYKSNIPKKKYEINSNILLQFPIEKKTLIGACLVNYRQPRTALV
jgi:hypothetical protein